MKTAVNETEPIVEKNANRDPLTGEPGSHPVGTGLGSAGAAAAGAAVGAAVGGPVGAVVGAIAGAVAGGAAGHAAGEKLDPTVETAYWRKSYGTRPYYREDRKFEDLEPAYRYGWEQASAAEAGGAEGAEGAEDAGAKFRWEWRPPLRSRPRNQTSSRMLQVRWRSLPNPRNCTRRC